MTLRAESVSRDEWVAKRDEVIAALWDGDASVPPMALPPSRREALQPQADAVMCRLFGPMPSEPMPQATIRVYNGDGLGKDLIVRVEKAGYCGVPRVALGLGFPSLFMDLETSESLTAALEDASKWLAEYEAREQNDA